VSDLNSEMVHEQKHVTLVNEMLSTGSVLDEFPGIIELSVIVSLPRESRATNAVRRNVRG
jgi:hypothetical protein